MSLESLHEQSEVRTQSKDIWSLVKDTVSRKKGESKSEDTSNEVYMFVCGSSQCAKSTIIARFLDKEEKPSPTVALEYTFGRRTKNQSGVRDIVHIYELGGGLLLSDLIKIPITEQNLHLNHFVICVDLSKPEECISTIEHFITVIGARIAEIMQNLESRGSKRPQGLKHHAWKRFGLEHPDEYYVSPFLSPLLIIGTKYDAFKAFESEQKKIVCKTLRFLAHINGAGLLFHSSAEENLNGKVKQYLSHLSFKTNPPKTMVTDYNSPLMVIAGQDSLADIGTLNQSQGTDAIGKASFVPLDQWKAKFQKIFPMKDANSLKDAVDLSSYPEPAIDTLKNQKELELEKMRATKDRLTKESQKDRKGKQYSRAKASQMIPAN